MQHMVLDSSDQSNMQGILSFISTSIWQLMIAVLLLCYGKRLGTLFDRLLKVKFVGFEGEFQVESRQPLKADVSVEVTKIGMDGFLTRAGVEDVISNSALLEPSENVRDALLLFRTQSQRTWLVSTGKHLFCILDDASTRQSGDLIQWKEDTASIKRVATWREGKRCAVDIGSHGSWLYSPSLHPDPDALREQIRALLVK